MSHDQVQLTDVVGTRPTITLKMDCITEPLPFPLVCKGCGAMLRFKLAKGSSYYRYHHPKIDPRRPTGRCPIGICYTIEPEFAARVSYRVVTAERGGLETDTVLNRLAEVHHVLTWSTHSEWFVRTILKP